MRDGGGRSPSGSTLGASGDLHGAHLRHLLNLQPSGSVDVDWRQGRTRDPLLRPCGAVRPRAGRRVVAIVRGPDCGWGHHAFDALRGDRRDPSDVRPASYRLNSPISPLTRSDPSSPSRCCTRRRPSGRAWADDLDHFQFPIVNCRFLPPCPLTTCSSIATAPSWSSPSTGPASSTLSTRRPSTSFAAWCWT